jgi:hypothetical protein
MAHLDQLAKPAVEELLDSDENQLYEELGIRRHAIISDPSQAGSFQSTATYDAALAGPLDELRAFGRSFFNRVSKDIYDLVCGTGDDSKKERQTLLEAFGGGRTTFAAVLASLLVSYFAWAPAIAAVLAALVVKLFFNNAYTVACELWSQKLSRA